MSRNKIALIVGAVFGFFLTASGLGDNRTIHEGLLLRDPYIYLMMASTVGTAWVGIKLLRRKGTTLHGEPLRIPRDPVRKRAIAGAIVFGVGFGIGATCPGITVAMMATGGLWGEIVLAGIFIGLWARGYMEERVLASSPARSD